ncbi:hypothetical protein [Salinarchaeum sp. Harcht-Bsk1]|uniref:hypothetical protein n=1 Tax=Salinarchaeum sp. Harcht-Bsk1 TaxID=1333523 RepID=UPI0009DBB11F|nr:hypothetical protein [Salinarchaeum sp. Harcht-Bsk1]
MNLDELRAVQDREREKDSLQHLRDSFYSEVGQYIGDLRAERERQADRAEDPFADAEVRQLTDEIETAEEVAESIYERRMGKVVKTASLAAAGYRAETEGLTAEESELFDDLVDRIEANQSTVLDVLAGDDAVEPPGDAEAALDAADGGANGADAPPAPPSPPSGDGSDGATAADGADGDGTADGDDGDRPAAEALAATAPDDGNGGAGSASSGGSASSSGGSAGSSGGSAVSSGGSAAAEGAGDASGDGDGALTTDAAAAMGDPDRVTVRITAEVGEIVGIDGTAYDLHADDVVTLPEENAMPLVEKDAATKVE